MKKSILLFGAILLGLTGAVGAADFASIQDRGSVQYSTSVAISVSTTPAILLSTGTGTILDNRHRSGPVAVIDSSPTASTGLTDGQYMRDRISLWIFNYSTRNVWIGYDANVTTFPGVNLGFKIPFSSGSFTETGAVANYWITSDDYITNREIVIKQSK